MCLAIPGKVLTREENPLGMTMGRVSFGGIVKDVSLAYLPDAKVGEYVLVHVGFAISKVDESEAIEVFNYLKQIDDLSDLQVPPADVAKNEQ
jgi:hydrogenase expression/formation protein HypC